MTNFQGTGGTPSLHKTPPRIAALAASSALRGHVVGFIRDVEDYRDSLLDPHAERGAPPRLCVRGEAGLGKSGITLDELARLIAAGWRIAFFVPAIDLADDLAKRAREDAGIDNVAVLRGRSQPDPDRPGSTMCLKADLAEALAALGYSVTETLCRDREGRECEHAEGCAYLRQLQERRKGAGLLIGSHAYLALAMEMLDEEKLDLVVIDEGFWPTLTRSTSVPTDRFKTRRSPSSEHRSYNVREHESARDAMQRYSDDTDEFHEIQAKAVAAVQAAQDEARQVTLADFRAQGLTAGDCGFATAMEYTRLGRAEINPAMGAEAQRKALRDAVQREAFGLARIWKVLAVELETSRTGQLMSLRLKEGHVNRAGELTNAILLDYSVEARFQRTPVLMIDASADRTIVDRFYPGSRFEEIAADWTGVRVRQVIDRTGSKAAFVSDANRERVRWIAHDLADQLRDRITSPSRRPLVVAQKHIEDAWREAGHQYDYDGGEAVPEAPFSVAHFGNVRGKDSWRETAALLIVGRIEPSPNELDRLARALFYASEREIVELEPDAKGRLTLPRRDVAMMAKDGTTATVSVSYHPDERADRVLRQIREGELAQAIARSRPVHRTADTPCEILVLSNVPLEVIPDTFATWAAVVPDEWRVMELCGLVPDLLSECAEAYPTLFRSHDAARQAASRRARRNCDSSYMEEFYRGCHTFPGAVRVSYRRSGNRRRREASIAVAPGETVETVTARLLAAFPNAHEVEFLAPLPCPVDEPEAAAVAAVEIDAMIEDLEEAGEVIWWRIRPDTGRGETRRHAARPFVLRTAPPDPGRPVAG